MYAQTGEVEFRRRADYIVSELAECQVTQGKQSVVLRFVPGENAAAGPIFGCRILPANLASA